MSEHDDPLEDVVLDPAVVVGAWANGTRVYGARDEMTLDFSCRVPESGQAVRVARTMVPLRAAFTLRAQLDAVLRRYAQSSMPEDAGA